MRAHMSLIIYLKLRPPFSISNGHYRSRVFFEEAFGHVYKATFKDGFVRSAKFFARPLERYIKAMDDPEGFESNMTSGHGFGTGDSQSFIAVPVPLHPNGEIYFKRNDTHRDEYGYEVVLVKPNEFVRDWATKELSHSRYDEYVFISDADQAAHYMHSTSINDHSPDMAYLGYCESLGISFTNGRHRTANSAILGAPYLAVDVCILGDPEQREIFKAKYEWQGDSNPYQGLTPEELDAMGPKYRPPSPSFDVPLQDEFVGDDASKSSFSFDPRKFLRKLIP